MLSSKKPCRCKTAAAPLARGNLCPDAEGIFKRAEIVFFNPGDAVAKAFDFAAARRSAQITMPQHVVAVRLVVAMHMHGCYSVF